MVGAGSATTFGSVVEIDTKSCSAQLTESADELLAQLRVFVSEFANPLMSEFEPCKE